MARGVGQPKDRRSQWLKGVLDLCLLGILAEGEAYGYDLGRALSRSGLGEVKGGTLYPALAKAEEAGLVVTTWRPSDAGPRRKYYALTEAGHRHLAEQRERWGAFAEAVGAFLGCDPVSAAGAPGHEAGAAVAGHETVADQTVDDGAADNVTDGSGAVDSGAAGSEAVGNVTDGSGAVDRETVG